MKYKVGIVKIHMIGAPVLILGLCRPTVDGEDRHSEKCEYEHWDKYQMFTYEDLAETKYIYNADQEYNVYRSQAECDKESKAMRDLAASMVKYQGDSVHFNSLNKAVKINPDRNEFNFGRFEQIELSVEEYKALKKELGATGWQPFDESTWGK